MSQVAVSKAVPTISGSESAPVPILDGNAVVAEGKVVAYPGFEVTVGAEVSGTIARMAVAEKSAVKKGDLIAEFKADEVAPALREATATLAEAENFLQHCIRDGIEIDIRKAEPNGPEKDASNHNVAAARLRRDSARAALDRVEVTKARLRVTAPIDGVIVSRTANAGETIAFGSPLVTIVDLTRLRIEAEVDEFDIGRCALRNPVKITADGYPDRTWKGEIEELADMVIPRHLLPADPIRPSDTSILPVRIALKEPLPLKLGQRVEVRINTAPEKPSP